MSEMIERVARAIDAAVMDWQHGSGVDIKTSAARAAIEAMREPTEGMIGHALIQPHPSVAEAGGLLEQARSAARIDWQTMIDEALK